MFGGFFSIHLYKKIQISPQHPIWLVCGSNHSNSNNILYIKTTFHRFQWYILSYYMPNLVLVFGIVKSQHFILHTVKLPIFSFWPNNLKSKEISSTEFTFRLLRSCLIMTSNHPEMRMKPSYWYIIYVSSNANQLHLFFFKWKIFNVTYI